MLNDQMVQRPFIISKAHNAKLNAYCKHQHISGSQLIRLFIEELTVCSFDPSVKSNLQETTFRVHNFVKPDPGAIIRETIQDGRGNKRTTWHNRAPFL